MSDKLRLVNGTELYDLSKDKGQENDIAKQFPEVVKKMRNHYNEWWSSVSTEFNQFPEIILGSDSQNPIELTCHDTHIHESNIPWNQNYIRDGKKNPKGGFFTVNFEQSGSYKIEISRWPFESGLAINDAVEGREATLSTEAIDEGNAMTFKKGTVKIGAWEQELPITKGAKSLAFTGNFTKGKTDLSAWFTNDKNVDWGAYYIRVTRLSKDFSLLIE
jgi:hypothetical protein